MNENGNVTASCHTVKSINTRGTVMTHEIEGKFGGNEILKMHVHRKFRF